MSLSVAYLFVLIQMIWFICIPLLDSSHVQCAMTWFNGSFKSEQNRSNIPSEIATFNELSAFAYDFSLNALFRRIWKILWMRQIHIRKKYDESFGKLAGYPLGIQYILFCKKKWYDTQNFMAREFFRGFLLIFLISVLYGHEIFTHAKNNVTRTFQIPWTCSWNSQKTL